MSFCLFRLPAVAGVLAAGVLLASAPVQAQYTGPGAGQGRATTIGEILKNPVDDQKVVLDGYLIMQLSDDDYLFGDGTDQIRVDIDDDDFPNVPVGENTRVRIHGEVEFDYRDSPEIDVERLEVR